MSNPTELPDLDRLTTSEARSYLVDFMMQHFSDKTFHRYVLGQGRDNQLAGDFAWQMATALRKIEAARRAQPEGEAPQAGKVKVLQAALAAALDQDAPAATLSPLCGIQQAAAPGAEPVMWFEAEPSARGRDAKEVVGSMLYSTRIHTLKAPVTSNPVWPLYAAPVVAPSAPGTPEAPADQDAARYQWLKERFTGYDFYWGGDPMAEREEDKGKCVIVFECGRDFRAGRDFEPAIDAAINRAAQLDGGQEGSAA